MDIVFQASAENIILRLCIKVLNFDICLWRAFCGNGGCWGWCMIINVSLNPSVTCPWNVACNFSPLPHLDYREVQKAVNTAQGLFQRWTELLQDPSTATREEIDWTTNELRNNLRSIEWDLEDLDETINILFCAVCAILGKQTNRQVFLQLFPLCSWNIFFYNWLMFVALPCTMICLKYLPSKLR